MDEATAASEGKVHSNRRAKTQVLDTRQHLLTSHPCFSDKLGSIRKIYAYVFIYVYLKHERFCIGLFKWSKNDQHLIFNLFS